MSHLLENRQDFLLGKLLMDGQQERLPLYRRYVLPHEHIHQAIYDHRKIGQHGHCLYYKAMSNQATRPSY